MEKLQVWTAGSCLGHHLRLGLQLALSLLPSPLSACNGPGSCLHWPTINVLQLKRSCCTASTTCRPPCPFYDNIPTSVQINAYVSSLVRAKLSFIQALHREMYTLEAGEMLVKGRSSAAFESALATVDCTCEPDTSLLITNRYRNGCQVGSSDRQRPLLARKLTLRIRDVHQTR